MPQYYNPRNPIGKLFGPMMGLSPQPSQQQASQSQQVAQAPEVPEHIQQLQQGARAIKATGFADEAARVSAEQQDTDRARTTWDDIRGGFADVQSKINKAEMALGTSMDQTTSRIGAAQAGLHGMPGQVSDMFSQLQSNFQTGVQSAVDQVSQQFAGFQQQLGARHEAGRGYLEAAHERASANIMEGKAGAIEGAVAGIEGNIRNATSEIDQLEATGQISPEQAAQQRGAMRLQGSQGLASAASEVQVGFNKLQADLDANFQNVMGTYEAQGVKSAADLMATAGAVTGGVRQAGVAGAGQLAQAHGQAYAAAHQVTAQIGAQLENIHATAVANNNASRVQLNATRSSAQQMRDTLQLDLLPEMDEPYAQYSNILINDYTLDRDIISMELAEKWADRSWQAEQAALEKSGQQGFWDTLFGFFQVMGGG